MAVRGTCWLVSSLLLALVGCGQEGPQVAKKPFEGITVRVGILDNPALIDILRSRVAEWEQVSGASVQFAEESPETARARESIDVLVFPGVRLGDLVDLAELSAIPDSEVRPENRPGPGHSEAGQTEPDIASLTERFPLDYQDLAQPLRERAGRYGETRFALPIGASALVLAYRRDAMESPTNQAAAKEHGLALNPPSTWAELDALARFFHGRDWDGDGQPDQGLAFASGPNPDSDALFLSLAASFGLPPDYVSYLFDLDTMEPLVTAPPFERALESFLSLAKSSPENPKGLGAAAARAAFRSGRVALLLDRAEFVADWIDRKKPLPIGVAPLPGSSQVYDPDRKAWVDANPPNAPPVLPSGGGWFAGLAARSNESARSAALDVVRFLACSESTRALSADPTAHMLPTRSALFAEGIPDPRAALGVDSSGWAAGIEAALDNPRAVPGLRVPDARGYMTDLSQARTRALAGTPPREALETLRAAWSERTKKLGLERQRWHYRRSLNRVASETPPPRAESP